jgi:TonB family protein
MALEMDVILSSVSLVFYPTTRLYLSTMRINLSLALLVVLLAQAVMADSKQATAEALFRRATEKSDPVAAVKGPYHIQYKLTFHGAPAGPVDGTYSKAWLSRHQWRSEVSMPGYSETEVSDGASLWIARKPHLFEPEVVGQLLSDLSAASGMQIGPLEKISKIREDTHGGTRLQCVEIERPGVKPSMGEKSLCFDESSGALVRITDGGRRTEFSEFENRDGAVIARKVQQFRGQELASEAELSSLVPQATADAGLLDHPADSRQFSNCDGKVTSGRLIDRASPVYPAAARVARQTGSVEIYLVIDIDGTPKDMEIVKSASKLLDDAAVEAIRKWRYEPYMCGGNPVRVESMTLVNFSL